MDTQQGQLPLPETAQAQRWDAEMARVNAETRRTIRMKELRVYLIAGAIAVLLGLGSAVAGQMYFHHNEQHWQAERAIEALRATDQALIQAINELAQRLPPK